MPESNSQTTFGQLNRRGFKRPKSELEAAMTEPFASRAQQRFAFATKQPWAKEWASKTDFGDLPARKKK